MQCVNTGNNIILCYKRRVPAKRAVPVAIRINPCMELQSFVYWTDNYGASGGVKMYSNRLAQWKAINKLGIPMYAGLAAYRPVRNILKLLFHTGDSCIHIYDLPASQIHEFRLCARITEACIAIQEISLISIRRRNIRL